MIRTEAVTEIILHFGSIHVEFVYYCDGFSAPYAPAPTSPFFLFNLCTLPFSVFNLCLGCSPSSVPDTRYFMIRTGEVTEIYLHFCSFRIRVSS